MRSIVMIISCLLAGSVPAIANEIFIEDAPLPLPRAFRSSGFDSGWRYARDDAFLFQLADNGDPQARAVAWSHTTFPERRKQWREDIIPAGL